MQRDRMVRDVYDLFEKIRGDGFSICVADLSVTILHLRPKPVNHDMGVQFENGRMQRAAWEENCDRIIVQRDSLKGLSQGCEMPRDFRRIDVVDGVL